MTTVAAPGLGPVAAPLLGLPLDDGRPRARAHVFGPWNSGTCLMFNYPHQLVAGRMHYHLAFWKHSLPPDYRPHDGCLWSGEDGPPDEVLDGLLLIAMVRLPESWLSSMVIHPYNVDFLDRPGPDPSARLRSRLRVVGRAFADLPALWNAYYAAYQEHLEPRGARYVRLEDLVAEPATVVDALGRHLELRTDVDRAAVIEAIRTTPAKEHPVACWAGDAARDRYDVARAGDLWSADDLTYIADRIDPALRARFGYPTPAWMASTIPNQRREG